MLSTIFRRWPWFALVASAAMLGAAHAFETFGHLSPCTLCLRQREAYWAAGTLAALGAAMDLTPMRGRWTRWASALLVLAFLYSLGWAGFHAGVEQHWWKGPAACSGGGAAVTTAGIQDLMHSHNISIPKCDAIVWSWLGLSMAAWNAVISLILVVFSALAALRKPAP
jgi:disulfide bond formation protein DsbB